MLNNHTKLKDYLCGYVADLLQEIGKLPDANRSDLTLPLRERVEDIVTSIDIAQMRTEILVEMMKEEENE